MKNTVILPRILRNMKKLVTKSQICDFLKVRNPLMKPFVGLVMGLLGVNKINRLYSPSADLHGGEFITHMLGVYNVTYDDVHAELASLPDTGGFIVVSNHPFGAIEGIILYDAISKVRPDVRIMANFLLSYIPNLKGIFIPVNPFTENPEWSSSVGGVKTVIRHLSEGKPLGVFPAGEVSRYHGHDYPEDIEWSESVCKIIRKFNVPVIPVFFDGTNSRKFYLCSKISSMLATALLPRELLNKRNKHFTFKIGKSVTAAELEAFDNPKDLAAFLRSRSYALEANIPVGNAKYRNSTPQLIDPPRRSSLMVNELRRIRKSSLLFSYGDYECYLADYDKIPNIIHEIGRRREESFRAIGEGGGKKLDIDDYDTYYKHLILWNIKDNTLAGGYRLGFGDMIMREKGMSGFYVNTLFDMDDIMSEYLKYTIELGRSFISVDYQKDVFPLMLLFKGLMIIVTRYDKMKYFLGPVSISSWYPKFYQSLMVHYTEKYHSFSDMENLINPHNPFVKDFLKVDIDALMPKSIVDTVDKFDRYMMRLSNGDYRMPTLFKKYLKYNAKLMCFNIDPDFNDTLDGLFLLRFDDFPADELLMLMRDCNDEEKERFLKRFGKSLDDIK